MDFEITADGELIRYTGPGGDVILPEGVIYIAREGVFDPDVEITTITIPASFQGYKSGTAEEAMFYFVGEDGQVKDLNEDADDLEDGHDLDVSVAQTVIYVPRFDLPHLESFKVSKNNPFYYEFAGLLLLNNFSRLADFPKQHQWPMRYLGDLFDFMRIDYEAIEIELRSDSVPVNVSLLLKHITSHPVVIYAPHVTKFSKELLTSCQVRDGSTFIVAPKIRSTDSKRYVLDAIALGYIIMPEAYDRHDTAFYQNILQRDEACIYRAARKYNALPVFAYYNELWSRKESVPLKAEEGEYACRYLVDQILYGKPLDYMEFLVKDYRFHTEPCLEYKGIAYPGSLMIALCCRYGGVDKLKALMSHGQFLERASFNERKLLLPNGSYIRHNEPSAKDDFLNSGAYKWLVFCYAYRKEINYSVAITSKREVRNLDPLSEDERIACINLLIQRSWFNQSHLEDLLLNALIYKQFKIAEHLMLFGIRLKPWVERTLASNKEKAKFSLILTGLIKLKNNGLVQLFEQMEREGIELSIQDQHLYEFASRDPEAFKALIKCTELDKDEIGKRVLQISTQVNGAKAAATVIELGLCNSLQLINNCLMKTPEQNSRALRQVLSAYREQLIGKKNRTKKSAP